MRSTSAKRLLGTLRDRKVEIGRKSPYSRYVTEIWLDGPEDQDKRQVAKQLEVEVA